MKKKRSFTYGDVINVVVLLTFAFSCFYPFWYMFIGSISGSHVNVRTLGFLPKDVTLSNYKEVLRMKDLYQAVIVSVARTVLGTALSVFCTAFMAYLFTLRKLPFRKFFYRMFIVTMYVGGGMIPTFLVYKEYHLLNTFWVYVIPGAVSVYNMILIKTFMENGIPGSLSESAEIDGAGCFTIFFKIMMPLSLPILATIALFGAVGHWNSWFDCKIYNMAAPQYNTLQYMLYMKLQQAQKIADQMKKNTEAYAQMANISFVSPESIRMTMTMVITFPILLVYPFLQKHFAKGIMIGAVKG